MATTIKLKNGSGAPLAGDLVAGEPALDLTNKRLYTEDSGGTVIEVGTNPTSLTTGTFTSTGIDDNATSTALTVTDSGIAATLTTAAQPNITSVGTLTGFTSTGIDDNATSTAITIDSSERTSFASASNRPIAAVSTDTNAFVAFQDTNTASLGHVKIGSETDDMVFYANAQERMRIKGSNVGIGEDSPDYQLHVKESPANGAYSTTTNMEATARFHSSESTTGSYTAIQLAANNGNAALGWWNIGTVSTSTNYDNHLVFQTRTGASTYAERMRISSIGNVGIGTDSPGTALQVLSSASGTGALKAQNASGASASTAIFEAVNGSGTTRLLVQNDGNVGIGATTVNRKLELSANNNGSKHNYIRITDTDTTATSNNPTGGIEFFSSDAGNGAGVNASIEVVYAGSGGGGEITFNTATNSAAGVEEAMRIDENGNVNIANTSSPLTLTSGESHLLSASGYYANARESASAGIYINKTGYTSGNTDLMQFRTNGSSVGELNYDGTDVVITQASDERLKNNITDSASAGSIIDAMRVRSFDWNSGAHVDYGFVAQELNQAYEPATKVGGDDVNEEPWAIKTQKLIPLLVKEIQDLRARVAELEGA